MKSGVGDDRRLAEQGPHLGAADVKYVRQTGQVGELHIVPRRGQPIAAPGPVDVQIHPIPAADGPEALQLRPGIQQPGLGGLGEIQHTGLDGVLPSGIGPMGGAEPLHLLRSDPAVLGGEGEHLVAGGLNGPGLMGVDVPSLGAQHPLIGAQGGGDHRLIGLGPAHQKFHRGLGRAAGLPDQLPGTLAVLIHGVAGGLLQIGLGQPLQNLGRGPLSVVTLEPDHWAAPSPARSRASTSAGFWSGLTLGMTARTIPVPSMR